MSFTVTLELTQYLVTGWDVYIVLYIMHLVVDLLYIILFLCVVYVNFFKESCYTEWLANMTSQEKSDRLTIVAYRVIFPNNTANMETIVL